MKKSARISLVAAAVLSLMAVRGFGRRWQTVDATFPTRIEHPAFIDKHPRVGIDESHRNFHTGAGLLEPLKHLLEADGFSVSAAPALEPRTLKDIDILVIADATADASSRAVSAFTTAECEAVRDWVRQGGALLLIADHPPYADAAVDMASGFGVELGRGYVADLRSPADDPTWLLFSLDNGLLADHPIMRGRNAAEKIRRVMTFTGESLGAPPGAVPLLKLGPNATESPHSWIQFAAGAGIKMGRPVTGRSQGLVLEFGAGRIAVFGDAALFSAQLVGKYGQAYKIGMNAPGNDDRQFALNVMHWLARLLN